MSARAPWDPQPGPSSLPPSPWILADTTTIDQATAALARLGAWLTSAESAATAQCAHALSGGEDDPVGVARWVGTLADRLRHHLQEASSWS